MESKNVGFKRELGLFGAVMIGLGALLGPEIFALPSQVYNMVGPLAVITYLFGGFVALFSAVNYSILGASIPIAGGGYTFVSRLMNPFLAFLTGWFIWIGNTVAASLYAFIFALLIKEYFELSVNPAIIASITVLLFGIINLKGLKTAIKFITIMNLFEILVLVLFSLFGVIHVETFNYKPFAPYGWDGLLPSVAFIYISYVGFELITTASEEIVSPSKTIPKAILLTIGIGTLISVLVILVMTGVNSYEDTMKSSVPFVYIAEKLFGKWGLLAGVFATIAASLSALATTLGASSRILYAMGRDGHLPNFFAKIHIKLNTPHYALILTTIVAIIFCSFGFLNFIAQVAGFGFLMGLVVVNLSVIYLYKVMPNLRKPFKVPFYKFFSIMGALASFIVVLSLEAKAFYAGLAVAAIGILMFLKKQENRVYLNDLLMTNLKSIKLLLKRKGRKFMRILIIGGGIIGQNIAQKLLSKDEFRVVFRKAEHEIFFVERDEKLCEQLEGQFSVPIIQGDGSKPEILRQVGLDRIDIAISAEEDDYRSMISAIQAKKMGVGKVLSVISDPGYISLLEKMDILPVSSPYATASMVENLIDRPNVTTLLEIEKGILNIVEVDILADSPLSGKQIKDVEIPEECVIAAIIRGGEFLIPRGKTAISTGDKLIFVGTTKAIEIISNVVEVK